MKPRVIKTFIRQTIKFFVLLSLIILVCKKAIGQAKIDSAKPSKLEFKNQGEQEDYWEEDIFKNKYKKEHYRKSKLPLIFENHYYQFTNAIIAIDSNQILTMILENGLFYPDVITMAYKYQTNTNIELDKDSVKAWRRQYTLIRKLKKQKIVNKTDTLRIINFEELKFFRNNSKKKRFRFWLFQKGILNPEVCFIELTNKNATKETIIETFIKGAKLTFFKEGWMII